MAAVSRAVVCQGDNGMTNKTNNSLTPMAQEAGGLPARTSASPPEAAARQRELREGLSTRRGEQGLVEKAEEGPGHDVERLRQRFTVAVAG